MRLSARRVYNWKNFQIVTSVTTLKIRFSEKYKDDESVTEQIETVVYPL